MKALTNPQPTAMLLQTPQPCKSCDGDGIDGSYEAALYYADRGELSIFPDCNGLPQMVARFVTDKRPHPCRPTTPS